MLEPGAERFRGLSPLPIVSARALWALVQLLEACFDSGTLNDKGPEKESRRASNATVRSGGAGEASGHTDRRGQGEPDRTHGRGYSSGRQGSQEES